MPRLLTALLLWACLVQPAQSAESIHIAMAEWSPLSAQALPQHGVIPQLIKEIFATQGLTVEYGFFTEEQAYTQVQQGHWQASGVWERTVEREAECLFSGVIYRDESVLLYSSNKPVSWDGSVTGAEQLKGLRIGIALGSSKIPALEEAERRGWVTYTTNADALSNLRKLAAGDLDAVDIGKDAASHLVRQHFKAAERAQLTVSQTYQARNYHLIFSRSLTESERLQQLFEQGLRQLKDSGRYAQIWQQFAKPATR